MITKEQLENRLAQLESDKKQTIETIEKLQSGIDQFKANASAIQGGIELCKELLGSFEEKK